MTGAPPEETIQKSAAKNKEKEKQREEHLIKRNNFPTHLTILPIAGVRKPQLGPFVLIHRGYDARHICNLPAFGILEIRCVPSGNCRDEFGFPSGR
jgi:hypothetical protein